MLVVVAWGKRWLRLLRSSRALSQGLVSMEQRQRTRGDGTHFIEKGHLNQVPAFGISDYSDTQPLTNASRDAGRNVVAQMIISRVVGVWDGSTCRLGCYLALDSLRVVPGL